MYCIYCGTSLPDGAVFCNTCGKRQNAATNESATGIVILPFPPLPEASTGDGQSAAGNVPMVKGTPSTSDSSFGHPVPQSEKRKGDAQLGKQGRAWPWFVLLAIIVIAGLVLYYAWVVPGTATPSTDSSQSSQPNLPMNSGDPQQEATAVINEWCQDILHGDYTSAYGLLTKEQQFQWKDANGFEGTLYDRLFGSSGPYQRDPTETITGCQISGQLLVQDVAGGGVIGNMSLDNSDGPLRINYF